MRIDSEKVIYRKLNQEDLNLFIKLRMDFIYEFHKDVDEIEKNKLETALKNYFEKHIESNEFIGVICEYDEKVISTAYLIIDEWPPNRKFINGKIGTILNVFTYPEYRKNGFGTSVLKKIIEEAKMQNVSIIDLLATDDGESVYRKLGFMETEDKSMRLKL
jgi:GNAT superfamily N-acetyltransferase